MPALTPGHMTDEQVIKSFPRCQGPGEAGFIIDFLGTRTRTSSISTLPQAGGIVEDYPIPVNFHATAREWACVLRAVLAAATELVVVELGAGWAPWLVAAARAGQLRGITDLRLVGVEASKEHCAFMAAHFLDNGLDPARHTLLHGVVGTADGSACFPVAPNPAGDWGARAVYTGGLCSAIRRWAGRGSRTLRNAVRALFRRPPLDPGRTESVPCYSLATLLRPFQTVDLVHVDIQGDEHAVLASGRDVLKDKVKRIVVGTHSRRIEQDLREELGSREWMLEAEETCTYRQDGKKTVLFRDGCQGWRNTGFDRE
jgi:FkbM family methyltransferase